MTEQEKEAKFQAFLKQGGKLTRAQYDKIAFGTKVDSASAQKYVAENPNIQQKTGPVERVNQITDTTNKQSELLKEIQMADEVATTAKPWYKNPWYIGGGIAGLLGIAGAIIGIRRRNKNRKAAKK